LGNSEPEDTKEDTEDNPNNLEEEEKLLFINLEEEAWRREEINIRRTQQSDGQSKETIPKEYWSFKETVFDKEMFDKLPPQRPWDHAIVSQTSFSHISTNSSTIPTVLKRA